MLETRSQLSCFLNGDKIGNLKIILSPCLVNIFYGDKILIAMFFEWGQDSNFENHLVSMSPSCLDYLFNIKNEVSYISYTIYSYLIIVSIPHHLHPDIWTLIGPFDPDIYPFYKENLCST